ncbi:hypothetical protein LCGC14_1242880 [marine sediment metagenome]|uniref:Uncharacterized protein n=1 Tax=marine sediment metagenome TaxID=412755 RepID=A0A0F9L976_9ZZZZ
MTARDITIDWEILKALDQKLAILTDQCDATVQALADVKAAGNELRGQLQEACDLGARVPESTSVQDLIDQVPQEEEIPPC